MIRLSHREGSTKPILLELGYIPRNSNAIDGTGIDLQAADIVMFCRSERDPKVIKTLSTNENEIEVIKADDDLYRRLQITIPADRLKYLDRNYFCYIEVTQDEEVSTWPEGDTENPYFVIEMLEKLSVS